LRKSGKRVWQKHTAKPAGIRDGNFELHCRAALLGIKRDAVTDQHLTDLWAMAEIVLMKYPEHVAAKRAQASYAKILEKGYVLNAEKLDIMDTGEIVFARYATMSNVEVMRACEAIDSKYVKKGEAK
jgi:hypothetical protein